MRSLLALLFLAAQAGAAERAIAVPELTPLGKAIIASVELAESESVAWRTDAGSEYRTAERNSVFLWGAPGTHRLEAIVVGQSADGPPTVQWLDASYSVGAPGPAPPAPLVKTLAELAGDKAPALAKEYADFLAAHDAKLFSSPAVFRAATDARLKTAGLTTHGAAAEIAKRINAAIGAATAFDDAGRKALHDALATIVAELGSPTPTTPTLPDNQPGTPVSFDGFRVVFMEESSQRPPWLYELLASPTIAAYLDSKAGKGGWRRWDADVPLANAPADLKELASLPKPSVPAVAIAANRKAVVLPLAKQTEAELLATLKQYGGP